MMLASIFTRFPLAVMARRRTVRRRAGRKGRVACGVERLEMRSLLAGLAPWMIDINTNVISGLTPLNGDTYGSNPAGLVAMRGSVYFSANDRLSDSTRLDATENWNVELWRSDGITAGRVADINVGTKSSFPENLTVVGDRLFFTADNGTNGRELWVLDGTGAHMVKDIVAGALGSAPANLTSSGGRLFFTANDGTNGTELWASDGSASGTRMVANINPSGDSSPFFLTDVAGRLFFTANSGAIGVELWVSDGATATLVKDISPGSQPGPRNLTSANGVLFFEANDGIHGDELWRSDGTTGGTVQITNYTGAGGDVATDGVSDFGKVFYADGFVYYIGNTLATSPGGDTDQWAVCRANAASGATSVVHVNTRSSSIQQYASMNGSVYWFEGNGGGLWKSDGTPAGTVNVVQNLSFVDQLTPVNGVLYFAADDSQNGREIWRTGGTAANTWLAAETQIGIASGGPKYLMNLNDTLCWSGGVTAIPGNYEFFSLRGLSSVTLRSSPGQAVYGDKATFTAFVDGGLEGVPPGGSVTFVTDGSKAATVPVTLVGGQYVAMFTTSRLGVGSHTVMAAYSGDIRARGSQHSLSYQVVKAGTTTTLTSSAAGVVFGQQVTFSALVGVVAPGSGVPTGSVTFRDGLRVLGIAALKVSGTQVVATCTTSSLSSGSHVLTATYSGDGNFTGSSTVTSLTQTINTAATMTRLSSSPVNAVYGQEVTLAAEVRVVGLGAAVPSGTVTFKDGANALATVTVRLVAGQYVAQYTTSRLPKGSHTLTAVYSGNGNVAGSTADPVAQTVGVTSTSVTAKGSSIAGVGTSIMNLRAVVGTLVTGVVPTGTVVFKDGTQTLGTGLVRLSGTQAIATFSFTYRLGSSVRHSVTAIYGGDSRFAGSPSPAILVTW